jgi:hypothetical protein
MNLEQLSPNPWKWEKITPSCECPEGIYDEGALTLLSDSGVVIQPLGGEGAGGGWWDLQVNEDDAEFITLARNALDVLMNRKYWQVRFNPGNQKWFVDFHSKRFDTILAREKTGYVHDHLDPFTALVEADRWYKENIEGKHE